jgi:hypothetical protein
VVFDLASVASDYSFFSQFQQVSVASLESVTSIKHGRVSIRYPDNEPTAKLEDHSFIFGL